MLERGADLLEVPGGRPTSCAPRPGELRDALAALERRARERLPRRPAAGRRRDRSRAGLGARPGLPGAGAELRRRRRSRRNIDLTAAAERRSWLERLLGRRPPGLAGPLAAAQERAAAHVERHSVWLHNSVRGAVGLGARGARRQPDGRAALVLGRARHPLGAALERAQHRPERRARACSGTAVGLRRRRRRCWRSSAPTRRVLWLLLPFAILLAGVRPGGDLVRGRPGRVHADAGDPLQHPRAGGLAGRARADRGHRDRLRA